MSILRLPYIVRNDKVTYLKYVIHRPGGPYIETVLLLQPTLKTEGTVSSNTELPAGERFYFFSLNNEGNAW